MDGDAVARAEGRVRQWIEAREPEAQHFEFKRELQIDTRAQRKELLKDLTAMGNGGGGTIVFGLTERKENGLSRVDSLSAMSDRHLPARVRDLVEDTVRPMLNWTLTAFDVDGGYGLVADIEPSRLGPYMIENLDEFRFWVRVGERASPMPERLVFDAYALAARQAVSDDERRSQLSLPIRLPGVWPQLSVTALPEFERADTFDPARVSIADIQSRHTDHDEFARLTDLTGALAIWADGFISSVEHAERNRTLQASLRLHRNGTIGYAIEIATAAELDPARALDATLTYIADAWARVGMSAGSVHVAFSGLRPLATNIPPAPYPQPTKIAGEPHSSIAMDTAVRITELSVASLRHRLVRRFADQLANVFGRPRALDCFDTGLLYEQAGRSELVALDGHLHWTGTAFTQDPWICVDGAVRPAESLEPIGWFQRGLLVDLNGNVIAATEFCDADGLPADFVPVDIDPAYENVAHPRERAQPSPNHPEPPVPTARWLGKSTRAFVTGRPDG